jgi:choice-of-anchor A domain-containing protein/uncharacterized repeat protein (TIGR01451 family)
VLTAVTVLAGSSIGAAPAVAAVRDTGKAPAVRFAGKAPAVLGTGEPLGFARASRTGSPAIPAYNPVTGNAGFTVFVSGNAALNASVVGGAVAVGGNLTFGSGSFNVATQSAGSFTASGDSQPTGLLVGGSVNWAAIPASGNLNVQSNSYVKIGNLTGSDVAQSGSAATHIVPTGNSYSSSPKIAEVVNQPTSSVNQAGLINFSGAFSTFSAQSASLAACSSSVTLTTANGTPLTFPLASGTNAYITLAQGTQNILNISAANLANISTLQFRNTPTATMPLIVNVNTPGGSFSWPTPNINGYGGGGAPNTMWNFPTATQLTIGGSQTIPGTIYAPGAAVTDNDSNGLNGGVIAVAYTQGGSSGTPALTIIETASPATATPGQQVTYTITVTDTGQTPYTGAAVADDLTGLLDDAAYNTDATATTGAVSYASPVLTWTGNLTPGQAAIITYSVTVRNPETGDRSAPSASRSS